MKKFAFFFLSVFAFAALIGCKTTETNVYSVDFVVYDGYSMESLSLADGASIPEPTAPVREGYTFDGWFKESSLSTPWNFATDTVTENVTLYAKWTPVSEDTFTVTFNTNGGSPVSTVQVANGGYVPEPLFPTKEGFNFMGWYLDAELEIEWLFYVNTVSSDMTLYAAWEAIPEEYSVTFNVDGGTVISAVSVYENEKISLPTDPEKTGYRFAGWYTDEALTNVWDFSADVVTENMQLYAKWKTPTDFNNTFKVLSIGNSFSEDAQRYLWSIANSYGINPENIVVANMYIGGCSLATHVANMISDSPAYTYQLYTSASISTQAGMKLSTALTLEDWDVITIQQVSQDSGMPSSYSDYVVRLVEYIEANATNPNVQIMWHMTWAYAQTSTHSGFLNYGSDQQTMYHAIINAVNQKILTVAQIESVIPSGTAIQNARTSYIGDYFNRDGYHLSDPLGRYIAGLMFFKQITGFDVSPSTIAYMPTGVSELQQQLAMEAVNNAYQSQYQVVASTYTTAPEPEVIDVNGVEFDFDYVQGFWNDNATAVAPSTDALYNSFAAVMPIPKYMLPVGSEIVIAEGYQYRVIFFEKVGEGYHVVYRTALYQTPYIEVDEAFWGNYDYVGFNITTNPTSAINTRLDEVVGLFHLYHPEGTGEGHVDSELAWTSGLWEVAGTSLTSNVNYLSSNPLTPGYFDTDDIFEVVSGYKFAYAVLSFDAGVYTVESVSAFQTEPLLLSASFKEGKELIAFIVTTTNEDMDLSSADLTTVVDIHPLAVPHTDATISFISGYWELGKHEVTTTNSNMEWLQGYAASAPQSKHYYENINAITIEAGYQVRVIYLEYDGYGQYTVALRSDNLTGTITLDETFWGSYEYIAFNISAVPAQNLSTQLDSLSEKFSYDVDPLVFGLGYWNTNGTALSASTVYAGSNPLPRQFLTEGTVITLESGYQVRVIFLSYSEENGYLVVSRSENFVGSFVLTDGLYQNYQYIAFNISTSPSTSDLTAALDTLPEKIVATEFTDTLVNHVDQPLTFVSGYWNNFAQTVTTGDTTFIKGFAASNVLSKDVLGIVSQIVIAEGYQVRVIYLDYSYNTYSVLLRTDNLVGTITLDDTFWGDYQYVAFNISSIPSTDLSGVLETLPDLITMVGEGVLHVDTELSWTSGLWETTQTELTPNVNYVSSNPLTPGYFDPENIFEVASGYKFAYVTLTYNLGTYTVVAVSDFQTDPLVIDEAFASGKELMAFIVTTTDELTDLSSVDMATVVDLHPTPVEHQDTEISFVSGYWELGKHAITTTNSNMEWLQGYAASQPQSKEYYASINSITVAAGYQVRVIYLDYDGYGNYTVVLRSDNLTGTITLDETFWGSYEYVAFNMSAVPAQNLSSMLDVLPNNFTYDMDAVVFSLGYWNTNATALTASSVYAGSNIIPRQFLTAGSTVTIEAGYQVRVIFFSYSETTGFKVSFRSENFLTSFVLTDGLYKDYQYVGFNISTAPTTTDLTATIDTLASKIVATPFNAELVAHVDAPLTFVSGYWNTLAQSVTTGDTPFIKGFAASNVISKDSLASMSTLEVAAGYQVRVIFMDYSYNTYQVLYRTDNMTGTIVLDEAFWQNYQYVAFNISSVPSTDLSGVLETLPPLLVFVPAE